MDISQLKEYLINEPYNIELLLENAGFYKIKKIGNKYVCGWTYEGMGSSINVDVNTVSVYDFSTRTNGDIITLLQNKLLLNFTNTIQWMVKELGIGNIEFTRKEVYHPFGGYYKKICKSNGSNEDMEIKTYDESILNDFYDRPSYLFYKDGIDIASQLKYEIMYDNYTSRISVPWRNSFGEIVGIMGRYNSRVLPDGISKWFPIIPFQKSKVLYGYTQNYSEIQNKRICFIGESEKFSMQLSSMNCNLGVATGGCSVHESQVKSLMALGADKYILAYDEGLDEDYMRNEAEKLIKNNPFYKHRVGYIYDKEGLYIPSGSKASPSDFGKDVFNKLYKEKVVWI